jgi:hypothetical protein
MVGEGVGLIITIKEERGGVLPRKTRKKRRTTKYTKEEGDHEILEIHERRGGPRNTRKTRKTRKKRGTTKSPLCEIYTLRGWVADPPACSPHFPP